MHIWRPYRSDLERACVSSQVVGPAWRGPVRERAEFEPHDRRTQALIKQWIELYDLDHSDVVVPLLEKWRELDSMGGATEKQRFLEPLIARICRASAERPGELIFVLLVCEPTRRSVARKLLAVRGGLDGHETSSWHRRQEARRINEIENERLHDVTRQAVLEALFRYPNPPPKLFFPWLRDCIAHRTLDFLRAELASLDPSEHGAVEAEAMQRALHGFEDAKPPTLRDAGTWDAWHMRTTVLPAFAAAEEYFGYQQVRSVCRAAVGRLPLRQREVIEEYFLFENSVASIAAERGLSEATVYNHKAQAQKNLHGDDCFFAALHGLQLVRDDARMQRLRDRYPDGKYPDGRRIVAIEEADVRAA